MLALFTVIKLLCLYFEYLKYTFSRQHHACFSSCVTIHLHQKITHFGKQQTKNSIKENPCMGVIKKTKHNSELNNLGLKS